MPVRGHHLLTLLSGTPPGAQRASDRLTSEWEELGGLRPRLIQASQGEGMSHPLGSDPLWVGVGRPGAAAEIGALACGRLWPGSLPRL